MTCPTPSADAPLVSSLVDYLQCHASALGQNGFEGAANGFFMTAMLTGCLTIYVALIGYRLVLGQPYSIRDAVVSCLRVGLIVTFCTRWPSYEAVFYRTVVEGPQEIAGQMLQSSGFPLLSGSEIAERLQMDNAAIQAAALTLPVAPSASPSTSTSTPAPITATPQSPTVTTPAASSATTSYSLAGLVFVVSTIGSLLAVNMAAAVLMAIGPLVLLLALFNSLVGLLENWMAALAGIVIATAGITILTELELGFVEARISQFSADGAPVMTDQALLLTTLLFSLCIIGVVIAAGFVGRRLKFRGVWPNGKAVDARGGLIRTPFTVAENLRAAVADVMPPSRSLAIANAVREQGRRERMQSAAALVPSSPSGFPAKSRSTPVEGAAVATVAAGLGHSLRRTAHVNRSISSARRGRRQ